MNCTPNRGKLMIITYTSEKLLETIMNCEFCSKIKIKKRARDTAQWEDPDFISRNSKQQKQTNNRTPFAPGYLNSVGFKSAGKISPGNFNAHPRLTVTSLQYHQAPWRISFCRHLGSGPTIETTHYSVSVHSLSQNPPQVPHIIHNVLTPLSSNLTNCIQNRLCRRRILQAYYSAYWSSIHYTGAWKSKSSKASQSLSSLISTHGAEMPC